MVWTKAKVSLALSLVTVFLGVSLADLQVGFYSNTCPQAESIVWRVVSGAALSNPNLPAILLRLHFHDCFVEVQCTFLHFVLSLIAATFRDLTTRSRGCDGSILVNNGAISEKNAFGHAGVRGFEIIEAAKAELEAACPSVVSCSDIVALAARDAISLANGPAYEVPTGRRDGRVSNMLLAKDMPEVSDSIEILKAKFMQKGLNAKELVLLSAARTIGTTACFFMTKRLYDFLPGGQPDPTINPVFLPQLTTQCPQNGDVNVRIPMDRVTERLFDKQILQNIKDSFAVLQTDAGLYEDVTTRGVVDSYFGMLNPFFGPTFESDFIEAIVKMGKIGVNTGSIGEIRRVCSAFN